jgi:predicted nucleotidyltransferase component of viral defense system
MIQFELIKNYYPAGLRDTASSQKYMLKEYLQLAILDFLSSTPFTGKVVFIGGTNLRFVKGIDRFSEDLDFDCKSFTWVEFMDMTDSILNFLHRSGMKVKTRDRENKRLTAFRRSYYFPELMYELGLNIQFKYFCLEFIRYFKKFIQLEPNVAELRIGFCLWPELLKEKVSYTHSKLLHILYRELSI